MSVHFECCHYASASTSKQSYIQQRQSTILYSNIQLQRIYAKSKQRLGRTRATTPTPLDNNTIKACPYTMPLINLLKASFPKTPQIFSLIILLLLFINPVSGLSCMTCVPTPDSTQLDRFRVTTRLSRPFCPMEPIQCDRDQDACVTITMHIGGGEYWLGAGCERRNNFQHMACQNVRTLTRSVQLGYVHERRALQRVCVCTREMCNSARLGSPSKLLLLLLIIFGLYQRN